VSGAAFPPAPWRLRGACAVVLAPVRLDRARAAAPPDVDLVGAGGWTVGGVLLAAYEDGATMTYDELIVFCGVGRRAGGASPPGGVVSHIWVDLPASVAGGRQIWNLPKELASFTAHGRPLSAFLARAPDGQELLRATLRTGGLLPRLPLPLPTAALGALDGTARWTGAVGRLGAGGPTTARIEVPAGSPLAGLGLSGTWPALSGTGLDLPFPAPAG
jgi:hypothetical protein